MTDRTGWHGNGTSVMEARSGSNGQGLATGKADADCTRLLFDSSIQGLLRL